MLISWSRKVLREGVPYKGSVLAVIHQLMGGLRSSMGYLGCATIDEMHDRAEFVEITSAGIRESHVCTMFRSPRKHPIIMSIDCFVSCRAAFFGRHCSF